MRCITSARFNMYADILRQDQYGTPRTPGSYVEKQNPITFEIERIWTSDSDAVTGGIQLESMPVIARGIVEGGIRVVGTTERYTPGGLLESADYVRLQFPPNYGVSKRDRITNIRSKKGGDILWAEEEHDGAPTVFEVLGVTPIFDPFGMHVENQALLQRAEVQVYGP